MDCPYCGNRRIRTSRLRWSDFPDPLIGRWPMRCRECGDRFFAWLPQMLASNRRGDAKGRIDAGGRKSSR
jgi:DNA-directed RNA polymerase subunit RPC12/RpoP